MTEKVNKIKLGQAESIYTRLFKESGFLKCKVSKVLDRDYKDSGITFNNLPLNVILQVGKKDLINPSRILFEIQNKIKKLFIKESTENNNINVMIHRKEVGRGKKREDVDDLVYMSFKDFNKLINKVEKW